MSVYKSLGICVGASTISAVYASKQHNSITVDSAKSFTHNGNPQEVLVKILESISDQKITITGKKYRKFLNLTSISEAEAIEFALENQKLSADLIISAGGENFIVYSLDKENKIAKVSTGNKCASGTGEFFLQQIKRMDLSIEEAVKFGVKGEPYNISGRCSVFCKSDCTHALNKGIPKENVIAGLSKMMAQKIIELTSKIPHKSAILIGGTTKNKAMLRFLKEHFENVLIPEEAPYFEALGAAVFALKNDTIKYEMENLFIDGHSAFSFHKPLNAFTSMVHFKEMKREIPVENDVCIIGLDVGSTTTKTILLRLNDNSILASEYLRTNGDPVKASIECYKSLKSQLQVPVKIVGLGVTGSGRQIAGLHALTKGIINEIIAHATATIYFDKDVDTIFEIGGQDAKYTYITSGIASDYAMNEACSAGTGSFLEEAANESLHIDYEEIGSIALLADRPPNFNDQCAAFISSDIKNALHEGLSKENIVAGLVYSICMNYNNRVKGNRPVGKKVFMQGGVCYNKAVPVAMAALTGKEIIVPPEPGLMGAFGVALEIKNRLELGLIKENTFNLDELINRQVEYENSFVCAGGAEKCDRKCGVSLIKIEGKKYPFGGACNKYYNLQLDINPSSKENDLVKLRQHLVYEKYIHPIELEDNAPTIGISKSFLTNTLYPLYYNFFTQLGFRIILGSDAKPNGIDKKESTFCYPAELAHGFFQDLIDKKPDYIFLPHISEIQNQDSNSQKKTCVLLQSESYYLQTTFKDELKGIKILSPVLNFSAGYESEKNKFITLAVELAKDKVTASAAFDFAVDNLMMMLSEFKQIGKNFLAKLEEDPERFAVVLFGRSYNAFAKEANLGIPQKFASRNFEIIPHDFLPTEELESYQHMYWGLGQQVLKTARFVKSHPQLFGAFITNFSCGPDSFIIGYFRNIMGKKPSLTLELDSHSADAGINTRIEAAIDIIKSYRELNKDKIEVESHNDFIPLRIKDSHCIVDSDGNEFSISDPSIKVLVPSMGRLGTELFSAAFRSVGINSEPLPVYDFETLMIGRGNSTCKECLPLQLNAGSMIDYYNYRKNPNEKTLFFMTKGDGPCRLGQYHVFLEDLINKREMKNVGVYTLTDEDSYGGLGNDFVIRGWAAVTVSDVLKDIYTAIQALAVDKEKANQIFEEEFKKVLSGFSKLKLSSIYKLIEKSAIVLSKIETKESIKDAKKVALIGEIFVRHDEFSRMDLIERLSEKGFVVKTAPIGEYVYYSNYLAGKNGDGTLGLGDRVKFKIRDITQREIEKKIKKALAMSGFYEYHLTDVEEVIESASPFIKDKLEGEAVLTVGSALSEILDHTCGVVSLGPFGCMPSRVAESILNVEMNIDGKIKSQLKKKKVNYPDVEDLPFLTVETDGNLFPQIIQSKIEIFMLQAERLHEKLKSKDEPTKRKYREVFTRLVESFQTKGWDIPEGETLPQYNSAVSEVE
ncbi:MAG: acyl-CoA dehydratase activase [Ignavibacteriales bacterium]|nr:acyl-CoA dehydratase activase [Ignavibacteriales bacterium]